MSDPFRWPALTGAAALTGTELACEIGIWGKVHRQASDYRWIARSGRFGGQLADINRRLRIGGEDRAVRATAWRAPWEPEGQDWFAVGTYPSRATDAWGRGAVLEKQVWHWRRPTPSLPPALAALALLPAVAGADDRLWWDRVDQGDWQRPDYALPLGSDACPRVRIGGPDLERVIEDGIAALRGTLDPELLAKAYACLLAGQGPALLRGLESPLSPAALAVLLLPLTPKQAARCSLAAWVPAALTDPGDIGRNWDLAATAQPGPSPSIAPEYLDLGAVLAEALLAGDPGQLGRGSARPPASQSQDLAEPAPPPTPEDAPSRPEGLGHSIHPSPRMHLRPETAAASPGLGYLYRFADRIGLRRLDLALVGEDLRAIARYSLLEPGSDPAGHPLIGWLATLTKQRPDWVDARDWGIKIDQLRSAALFLLPHPRTLDLVGLPDSPAVPALLAALAADPRAVRDELAAHGIVSLRGMLDHSLASPDPTLATDIREWMGTWLAASGSPELEGALRDLMQRPLAPSATSPASAR